MENLSATLLPPHALTRQIVSLTFYRWGLASQVLSSLNEKGPGLFTLNRNSHHQQFYKRMFLCGSLNKCSQQILLKVSFSLCLKFIKILLSRNTDMLVSWPSRSGHHCLPQRFPWRPQWNLLCRRGGWRREEAGWDYVWMPYASHRLW